MARPKLLSDTEVLVHAHRLFMDGGGKALTFGNLAKETGLAASTLAQRFSTVDGLTHAVAAHGWHMLITRAREADGSAREGMRRYLAALGESASVALRLATITPPLSDVSRRAAEWRNQVRRSLAARLETDQSKEMIAHLLFASWLAQPIFDTPGFRIEDLAGWLSGHRSATTRSE